MISWPPILTRRFRRAQLRTALSTYGLIRNVLPQFGYRAHIPKVLLQEVPKVFDGALEISLIVFKQLSLIVLCQAIGSVLMQCS
jgi:hypothetical protein